MPGRNVNEPMEIDIEKDEELKEGGKLPVGSGSLMSGRL